MIDLKTISSLGKVLPQRVCSETEIEKISVLENETASVQFAFSNSDNPDWYKFRIDTSDGLRYQAFFVRNVPVGFPTFDNALDDENYISHNSGLYPDWLEPVKSDCLVINDIYQSVWVKAQGKCGSHYITFSIIDKAGNVCVEKTVIIEVIPAALPKQELIYTQWFHTDCIYSHYGCEPFSQQHWELIEKFLLMAHNNGINMILTPVFTPPLDTYIGGERPTVQLVKITVSEGNYEFDFENLERFITLCKNIGFEYFEMPHLFTQWGAKFTPKIVAEKDGKTQKIFGWNVEATSPEYDNFLSQFIPALKSVLNKNGILPDTYFHISDEPESKDLKSYSKAYALAGKYLDGCKIIDALSDFQFYKKGIIKIPVPSTDHIEPFISDDIKEKWCYYCCVQNVGVSNRFITMPSARNRSIGLQLYKYGINGFLHWGYNFYYTQYSRKKINPFVTTDAGGAFPSGDSFSVYPSEDGPNPAISLFVFNEALQDIRAFKLLESFIGKTKTISIIEDYLGKEISFSNCFDEKEIIGVRQVVNEKIKEFV